MMKRSILSILLLLLVTVTFIGFPNESSANKARGDIKDGNATGSKYSPTDVESSVKRAWERENITRGGKASTHTPSNGRHLVFDVYEHKGWNISGNTLTFEGWSVNIGRYHHDRYNQATYKRHLPRLKADELYNIINLNLHMYKITGIIKQTLFKVIFETIYYKVVSNLFMLNWN